jgi:hypothetical protein
MNSVPKKREVDAFKMMTIRAQSEDGVFLTWEDLYVTSPLYFFVINNLTKKKKKLCKGASENSNLFSLLYHINNFLLLFKQKNYNKILYKTSPYKIHPFK